MQKFAAVKKELIPNSAARRVFGLIGAEMGLIEAEFERQGSSNIQVSNNLGDYLRASGGKRIRPALLVLAHHAIDKGERTGERYSDGDRDGDASYGDAGA
ncbi:MAG: hypothetical protein IPG58_02040 [Acidobacteria bacterium]|nr:hypothetical protein [Acidobacteriota bacterium]